MIDNLKDQLIRDEGKGPTKNGRLMPYYDTKGKLTIGIGRNIDDVGISNDEALYLLNNDILRARHDLETHLPWTSQLDFVRYTVLVNLTFNMGIDKLLLFKRTLAAMQHSDWEIASNELLNSNYAKQVGERAQRLAKQLLTGEWQ